MSRLIAMLCLLAACAAPVVQQQTAESPRYQDVIYSKLASEAFVDDYKNTMVHFMGMFIGEWTITQPYSLGGIRTADRVFINHRDVAYVAQETGLGSSDMGLPGFALSVPKGQSELVYALKRGEVIEVWGRTEAAGMPGKRGLHVLADSIRKQTQ